jgi:hypothetical protein
MTVEDIIDAAQAGVIDAAQAGVPSVNLPYFRGGTVIEVLERGNRVAPATNFTSNLPYASVERGARPLTVLRTVGTLTCAPVAFVCGDRGILFHARGGAINYDQVQAIINSVTEGGGVENLFVAYSPEDTRTSYKAEIAKLHNEHNIPRENIIEIYLCGLSEAALESSELYFGF